MIAVIPTIGEAPQLRGLVAELLRADVEVLLTVNRPDVTLPPFPPLVWRIDVPDTSIYHGWNLGLGLARTRRCRVAILNDDIVLEPGALTDVARLMDDARDVAICGFDYTQSCLRQLRPVEGSYRHGGIGGWAFIADPTRCPDADEDYEWWYGDDDLFFTVADAGHGLAIAEGCWVTHQGETTARNHPWTDKAKLRDLARFTAKWGDR